MSPKVFIDGSRGPGFHNHEPKQISSSAPYSSKVYSSGAVDMTKVISNQHSQYSPRRPETGLSMGNDVTYENKYSIREESDFLYDDDDETAEDEVSTVIKQSDAVSGKPAQSQKYQDRDKNVRIHINTHINKHSDSYIAPIITIHELLYEDDEFIKFKRTNITFDTYSAIPLLGFQGFIFVTRASIYKTFYHTPYFTAALTLAILAIGTFSVSINILLAERFTNPNYIGNKKVIEKIERRNIDLEKQSRGSPIHSKGPPRSAQPSQYDDIPLSSADEARQERFLRYNTILKSIIKTYIFQEAFEILSILGTTSIGLYLYARVSVGACPANVTLWESQECNPVHDCGSIPHDQVFLCYLVPLLYQLMLKRTRFRTIMASWAIATLFILLSILRFGAYLQVYSLLYSLPILYIHYETERFLKASYVQSQFFLQEIFKQQKREKRNAVERVNYEKMMEKQQYSREISHLKILIDNIAHNLRTPIQSINMGIGLLRSEYAPLLGGVANAKAELPFDFLVKTISASCMFMTMAINRSVDFTKINSNVTLVPTLETQKFLDVLSEPIDCIKTLQNTVTLHVSEVPSSMCSHIIIDAIWVKESLLCLLSNSVKYSSGGTINVITEIVSYTPPEAQTSRSRSIKSKSNKEMLECLYKEKDRDKEFEREKEKDRDRDKGKSNKDHSKDNNSIRLNSSRISNNMENERILEEDDGEEERDETLYIKITVIDEGVGVSEEYKSNVFKPIRPTGDLSGGKERGTGLGLYALSKRMEVLRGACGVCSRPDGRDGAVFWFLFPYRPDLAAESYGKGEGGTGRSTIDHTDSEESYTVPKAILGGLSHMPHSGSHSWAQRRTSMRKASRSLSASFYGELMPLTDRSSTSSREHRNPPLRVLLIDDSQTVVLIVTRLLEEKGHVVEVMKNGFAGLNRMKEVFNTRFDFDLVLLDLQAPVLDGLECVTRYRAFEQDQMTKLSRHLNNKRKNDTVKLLLHSNYFRVNYASNLTTSSSNFNVDNFKYLDNTADKVDKMESEKSRGGAGEERDKTGDIAPKRASYGDKLINVPDGFDCDENNHDGGNNYNRSIGGSNYDGSISSYNVNSHSGTYDNSIRADSTDDSYDNKDDSKDDEEREHKPAGIRFKHDSYDTFNRYHARQKKAVVTSSDVQLRRGTMAIVGMSLNDDEENRLQALKKGMNFFLKKPFSAGDLHGILKLFDS